MATKDKIWYGGDYNPDQWDAKIWDDDFKFFEEANINMLTLPVFSWSRIETSPGNYDFEWLIEILERAKKAGISICLATSTAVQPAWLSKMHPEILPTDAHGQKKRFGGRVKYCPNSAQFKYYAGRLVRKMAEITQQYDHVVMWHIGNEYDNYCYCETCKDKFQDWVKARYHSVEKVNEKWNLRFWGHGITAFDEIEIPDFRTENWEMGGIIRTNFQTIHLDYMRFMNDSILSCYLYEKAIVNEMTPAIPVTTNFMGAFKPLNYFLWAEHLDVISWDHYPGLSDGPHKGAMLHDLMRSLKKDRPFWLMEQSPSQQNWAPYNTLKRPGQLRLQSFQTVARGADAILYFQMRRSIANCEKFHGALIDHHGGNQTRVFKECKTIGEELGNLSEIIGSTVRAEVGIVFDWENWWAIEMSSGPSIALSYMAVIEKVYKSVYKTHQMIDFLNEADDYNNYKVIYAPMFYMAKPRIVEKLKTFVKSGGTLILTTFSGIVDENDHVTTKGYPGAFREMAGIWVEEIDGLLPEMKNTIKAFDGKDYKCQVLCDIINVETAEILATYGDDFYENSPVVTVNKYGNGEVYYVGTLPDEAFMDALAKRIIGTSALPEAVEISKRFGEQAVYTFCINYTKEPQTLIFDKEQTDLLTGQKGKTLSVEMMDLLILREDL